MIFTAVQPQGDFLSGRVIIPAGDDPIDVGQVDQPDGRGRQQKPVAPGVEHFGPAAVQDGVIPIVGQAHFVFSSQEETPEAKFKAAVTEYANGNYGSARTILTGLTQAVEENEQNKIFLGNTYLLLGASEEMLKENEAASAHYLKAKELLGEREAVIEGLSFSSLSLYLGVFATEKARDEAAALNAQFEEAKKKFFAEDYEGARLELEKLMSTFAALEGWEILKGETYLLLGATYEKLKYKELSVKYYCKAKEILGVGKTIAGLELKKLKL